MNEQLISFETAKLAKEKGFNVECKYGYTRLKELMTIDRSQESFFEGASRNYRNSELESYNKSYLECNDDEYVCIYTAPAQSLLAKWLREEHHLIVIVAYQYEYDSTPYSYWIYKENNSLPLNQWINDLKTYEEALEAGLQEALKLI